MNQFSLTSTFKGTSNHKNGKRNTPKYIRKSCIKCYPKCWLFKIVEIKN